MNNISIKSIPNIITLLRLLLAVPIFLLIVQENYSTVLWIALIAGLSDGIDGWLARKLDALSHYGAIVDPLSDKVLLISTYVALVLVGLLPWWLAVIIVLRDVIIVSGALAYYCFFGRYEVASSRLGKISTCVQIVFVLMLLTEQVYPLFPELSFQIGLWLVIFMAFASGGHYVYIWGKKALKMKNSKDLFKNQQ